MWIFKLQPKLPNLMEVKEPVKLQTPYGKQMLQLPQYLQSWAEQAVLTPFLLPHPAAMKAPSAEVAMLEKLQAACSPSSTPFCCSSV